MQNEIDVLKNNLQSAKERFEKAQEARNKAMSLAQSEYDKCLDKFKFDIEEYEKAKEHLELSNEELSFKQKEIFVKSLPDKIEDISPEQWKTILSHNGEHTYKKNLQKYLQNTFIYCDWGYFSDTEQCVFDLRIKPDNELELTNRVLNSILPHIKFNKNGEKTFSIMEFTLSEDGIYNLMFSVDGKIELTKTRYGRINSEQEFESTMDALKYIQENHWLD